jgi:hypothetical protein
MLIKRTIQIDGSKVTITEHIETKGKGSDDKKPDPPKIATANQAGPSFLSAAETVADGAMGGGDDTRTDTGGGDDTGTGTGGRES